MRRCALACAFACDRGSRSDVVSVARDIQPLRLPGDRERAVAAIAAHQHDVIAWRQLRALGIGRGAIRHRLATGRLHAVQLGVYAVGSPRLAGRGRWMAAVLSCGEDALLSHRDAAAVWDIGSTGGARIDVTTIGRGRRERRGIILHRVRRLHPDDRAELDGIPTTSLPRTLLDLAEVVSRARLEDAFESAERLRLLDLSAVAELFERSPGRRGLKPLRALLADAAEPAAETRSELERRFLIFCREAGLPRPSVNVSVAGFEVDAFWPEARLVVELDGYAFHRTRTAFERDRARDAELQLGGCRVLRITHRMLEREAAAVAERVHAMLRRPPPQAALPRPPRH